MMAILLLFLKNSRQNKATIVAGDFNKLWNRTLFRTIGKAIRSINAEEKNWRKEIFYFIFQYWTTPHCPTKETPAKLLMGREFRVKIPAFTDNESKFLEDAKQKDFEQNEKMKTYYDKHFNTKESSINIGDYVLLWQKLKNKL